MMKQAFTKLGVFTLLSLLCPAFLYAQVVTDERMFSFEDPQVPECISATRSQLSISDTHYKDGKHSMEWAFNPGAVLELKKDLKFEKKDPTGKTCIFRHLSCGYTMKNRRKQPLNLNF